MPNSMIVRCSCSARIHATCTLSCLMVAGNYVCWYRVAVSAYMQHLHGHVGRLCALHCALNATRAASRHSCQQAADMTTHMLQVNTLQRLSNRAQPNTSTDDV
jgi:hypothetical protein